MCRMIWWQIMQCRHLLFFLIEWSFLSRVFGFWYLSMLLHFINCTFMCLKDFYDIVAIIYQLIISIVWGRHIHFSFEMNIDNGDVMTPTEPITTYLIFLIIDGIISLILLGFYVKCRLSTSIISCLLIEFWKHIRWSSPQIPVMVRELFSFLRPLFQIPLLFSPTSLRYFICFEFLCMYLRSIFLFLSLWYDWIWSPINSTRCYWGDFAVEEVVVCYFSKFNLIFISLCIFLTLLLLQLNLWLQ